MALSKQLQAQQVDLVVLDQGHRHVDCGRPDVLSDLGAIAEFEHALMSERTRDGLDAARARGPTGGQKPKLTPRQAKVAQDMYDELGPDGRTPSNRSPTSSASRVQRSTATCSAKPTEGYMSVGAAFLNGTPTRALA